jgi:tetrapyrrole methylase family protein / MazG family protein
MTSTPPADRFERAGRAFAQLCRVMATLRAPGGCAWDREQTLQSLMPYLVEETYETVDAVESGDAAAHREELGDLLLQIVFQAEIAEEQRRFTMAEVADGIHDKLVRRHPHVFAGGKAEDAASALKSWEAMKAKERKADAGILSSIPKNMPALLRATRMGEKAAAVGFDWYEVAQVRAKVDEELRELAEAMKDGDRAAIQEELGDLLYAIVNLSRRLQTDAEAALRAAADKFQRRFRFIEEQLIAQNRGPRDATLDELNTLWEEAKRRERTGGGSR